MILSSSCASFGKGIESYKIEQVLEIITENAGSYYMKIKFNRPPKKKLRESLVKEEFKNRFPQMGNRTVYIKEYLGKLYGEYLYDITVDGVNTISRKE
jgi:hypothetical protein